MHTKYFVSVMVVSPYVSPLFTWEALAFLFDRQEPLHPFGKKTSQARKQETTVRKHLLLPRAKPLCAGNVKRKVPRAYGEINRD